MLDTRLLIYVEMCVDMYVDMRRDMCVVMRYHAAWSEGAPDSDLYQAQYSNLSASPCTRSLASNRGGHLHDVLPQLAELNSTLAQLNPTWTQPGRHLHDVLPQLVNLVGRDVFDACVELYVHDSCLLGSRADSLAANHAARTDLHVDTCVGVRWACADPGVKALVEADITSTGTSVSACQISCRRC